MPPPQSPMLRRSFLTLLGLAASPALPALATQSNPAAPQRWFIQVWLEGDFPFELDMAANPGRIEVSIGGTFVACALAAVYRSKRNEMFLVPLSIGASAIGRKEDIKVEVYGELKRLVRPTIKITEIGA